jgi:hypothetical protein
MRVVDAPLRALLLAGTCAMMTTGAGVPTRTRRGEQVPLSEDEERILKDIEREFYENDPAFAREVRETTLYKHAWRNIKLSLVGFVAGLVLLVAALSSSYLLAFGGFLVMLGCALVIERNARKMGRAGLETMTKNLKSSNGLKDYLGSSSEKMRERFRRDEE